MMENSTIYDFLKLELLRMRTGVRTDDLFAVIQAIHALYHNYSIEERNPREFFIQTSDISVLPPTSRVEAHTQYLHHVLSTIRDHQLYNADDKLTKEQYHELVEMVFSNLAQSSHVSISSSLCPKELSLLYRYLIQLYECHSVYNPFAGMATIGAVLNGLNIEYLGQEISYETYSMAQMRMDACDVPSTLAYGDCTKIWPQTDFDAVVAMQPWGVRTPEFIHEFDRRTIRSLEDYFYYKAVNQNKQANVIIGCSSASFCTTTREQECREMLCRERIIDAIIELPDILYSSITPSVIVITPNKKHDSIKFINAKSALLSNSKRRGKVLDLDAVLQMMHPSSEAYMEVPYEKIEEQNYMLSSMYYAQFNPQLLEGQEIAPLSQFAEVDFGRQVRGVEIPECKVIVAADFYDNIFDVVNPPVMEGEHVPSQNFIYRLLHGPHLVLTSNETDGLHIYMHKTDTDFAIRSGYPLKLTSGAGMSLEYLAYALLQNKHMHDFAISRFGRSIQSEAPYLLNCRLVIDADDRRQKIVNLAIETERAARIAVLTADQERATLLQAGSDLIHMLGRPLSRQTRIIERVNKLKSEPNNEKFMESVVALVDVSSYIQRIIRVMEADYQKAACVKEKQSLTKVLANYCRAWKNFGPTNFELTTDIANEDLMMELNETHIMVMMDTILDNARRHGFEKTYDVNNLVNISLTSTSYNGKPFALLSVANNGAPFNENFGVKGFISRSHFDGLSGRSGLGGYHIYSIVKKHGGFLTIRKDEQWNFILDILLPLSEDYKSSNYSIYGYETV